MSTGLYTAFIVGTLTVVGWCTAQEYVTGSVTSDREMYYVGENLTVHCFLNQPVASNASFEYGPGTMPSDYVTVVNETYLRLDKQLTEADLPDSSCACFIGDEVVGDVLDIWSEYRPQGVKNLNYEYYNKKDFSASWSLGVKYRLGLDTERQGSTTTMITAEYANDSDHGPWMKCDLWQNGTGCVARNLNGWTQLSLRVTVTNVRRNDTAVTQFDRLALVSDEGMTRVTTEKPLYYVGENMTVHCFLERTGASDASFVYGSDTLSRDYVTVVTETYLRLDRQVTAMDPFKAPCFCVDGDKKTVGSAYILTEYRPQNVTDVKFEYYDQETFHASWSIDVNYKSGTPTLNTSITVIKAEYTRNITHGPWDDCKLSEDSSGCTTRGKGGWPRLSLRVTVANIKRNDSAIALFYNLYLDTYVKPAPVDIRRTEILNSTCAKVVWWSNRFYPSYRITWDVTTLNTSEEHITICYLHPSHTYTLSVQALPRSGFPGVLQTVTLHMPEDAPSTGPKLTEGGYYRKQCSTGQNQSAHIYIYFKPVPPEDRNSATLNYTAKLYMDGQETQELHLQDPESNMLTVSVPCGQGFSVTMYATNRVGVSPQTNLTVLADDKGLHKEIEDLDLRMEEFGEHDMNKTARWTWKSNDTVIKQLRLFYCDAKTCTAEACTQWTLLESIDVNIENQNYTFNAGKADRFGFAAATFHGSWTGIVFTKCTYSTDYSQGSLNLDLKAPILISVEGQISVSWDHTRCDSGSRLLIHHWIVEWCLLKTCRNDEVYTRNSSVKHTLRDVQIYAKYSIRIAAVTSHGNTSYSDPSLVEVKPSEKTDIKVEHIAGILVAALIVVILFIVLGFCRIKWKEAKTKFSKTIVFPIPNRTWKNASDIMHQPRNSVVQKGYEHKTSFEDKVHRENKKKQDDCESGYGGSEKPPYKHYLNVPKTQEQRSLYTMSVLEDQQGGESSSEDNQGCKTHNVMDPPHLSTNKTPATYPYLFPPFCSPELLNISEQNRKLGVEKNQGMAAGKEISKTGKFTCNSLELLCNIASAPMHPEYILCRSKLDSLEPPVESTIELLGSCRSGEAQQDPSSSVEISAARDPLKTNKTSDESCTEDKVSTLSNGVCQPTISSKQSSGSDINEIVVCNRSQKTLSETESHNNLLRYVPMKNLSEMTASPRVVPFCGDDVNVEGKDVLMPSVARIGIDRNMLIPVVMKMGDGKSQAEKKNTRCLMLSENEGGGAVMDLYVTMAGIEHMKNHTEEIKLHDQPFANKDIDNGGVELKREKEERELFRAEKLNVDEVQSSAAVTDLFKDGCNYWNSSKESGTKKNELLSTEADEDIKIKAFPEECSKAEEKSLKKDFKCTAHSSFHTQGYISIDTVVHPSNMGNLQICG